jgi:2-oxoglutarate dehydrogenase complex dehydrogenase (E1) component-like enzyme
MYAQWQADPNSVDQTWQEYFSNPNGSSGLNELLQVIRSLPAQDNSYESLANAQSNGTRVMNMIRAF